MNINNKTMYKKQIESELNNINNILEKAKIYLCLYEQFQPSKESLMEFKRVELQIQALQYVILELELQLKATD